MDDCDILGGGAYLYEKYQRCIFVDGNLRIKGGLYLDDEWDEGKKPRKDTWEKWKGAMKRDRDGYLVIPCDLMLDCIGAGLMVTGDLDVRGSVVNPNGDWGLMLFVGGTLRAKRMDAGGAHIVLRSAEIRKDVEAFDNHGSLAVKSLTCKYFISEDHASLVDEIHAEAYFSDWLDGGLGRREMKAYLKRIGVRSPVRNSHYLYRFPDFSQDED